MKDIVLQYFWLDNFGIWKIRNKFENSSYHTQDGFIVNTGIVFRKKYFYAL